MKQATFLFLMVVFLLAACSNNETNTNTEAEKEVKEVEAEEVSSENAVSALTEFPLKVGAHPRCCLGINVLKAEKQTNPDSMTLELELRTLLGDEEGITDTTLYLGDGDTRIPMFHLLTEQGSYQGYLDEPVIIEEGEPKIVNVIFTDAKGQPLGLSVKRVFEESQMEDGSYKDVDNQGTFAYLEDVNEDMMKRIGRGLFNQVTSIELTETEDEAREILTPLFDEDSLPEIYYLLFGEIAYGAYSHYDIKYLDETVEFKDKGAFIQYQASVEINLYDQSGAIARTKGFGVDSLISISPATGHYIFSSLDYDYLTGTDFYWDDGE